MTESQFQVLWKLKKPQPDASVAANEKPDQETYKALEYKQSDFQLN